MSRGAFITTPDAVWGAGLGGFEEHFLEDPSLLEREVLRLASGGCVVIAVTDDLLPDGPERIRSALGREVPGTALLVLAAAESRAGGHLAFLRERFSTALGIDVWKVTSRRAGVKL